MNHVKGYEVIVKFTSLNITNNGVFYTDSNGLDMQRRKLNWQKSFDLTLNKFDTNTTENYYPVTSAIVVRDNDTQMTIMNDRIQGGTSLENGSIELMQNRRMIGDDGKGMGEGLDEFTDYN